MTRHHPLPALLAAAIVSLLAVGCGPLPGQTAAAPRPSPNVAQVAHQLAQCIRAHGDPSLPDPIIDAQGNPQLPPGTATPPPSALQACSSLVAQLQHAAPTDHPDPNLMRQFARCMRAHGITDWPDPDAEGRFHMPPTLADFKASPRLPQIRAAWAGPCSRYDPSGHIEGAP